MLVMPWGQTVDCKQIKINLSSFARRQELCFALLTTGGLFSIALSLHQTFARGSGENFAVNKISLSVGLGIKRHDFRLAPLIYVP